MKHLLKLFVILATGIIFQGCSNDNLTPLYGQEIPGKIIIRAYSALQDSLQVISNGKALTTGGTDAFKGTLARDFEFVYYGNQSKNIDIVNKSTGAVLQSYTFAPKTETDTLSFYANDGIWINNVLSSPPGTLSGSGRTGYRFIFPTLNRYSNSGYTGTVDAIIKKVNGEVLGVAENIGTSSFSNFVEFAYTPPPILNIELVKHGTTQSYMGSQPVTLQIVMQNNRSRLIVLNEKANESGAFTGVEGTINLADYFNY